LFFRAAAADRRVMGAKGKTTRQKGIARPPGPPAPKPSRRLAYEKRLAAVVSAACDRWLAKHEDQPYRGGYDRYARRWKLNRQTS
jgi:hypothetical protein